MTDSDSVSLTNYMRKLTEEREKRELMDTAKEDVKRAVLVSDARSRAIQARAAWGNASHQLQALVNALVHRSEIVIGDEFDLSAVAQLREKHHFPGAIGIKRGNAQREELSKARALMGFGVIIV